MDNNENNGNAENDTEADDGTGYYTDMYVSPGANTSPRVKAAFEELSAALAEIETAEVAGFSSNAMMSIGLTPMAPDALRIFGINVGGGGGGGGGGTGPIDIGHDCTGTLTIVRCRGSYTPG